VAGNFLQARSQIGVNRIRPTCLYGSLDFQGVDAMENQMIRFKLRTLLIVLAIGPPVLALLWFEILGPLIYTLTDTRPVLKRDGGIPWSIP
jgi:hypothetical protein